MRAFSLGRAFRFFGVGGISTAIYWVILLGLTALLRLNPTLSSVVAYGAGWLASYAGHRNVTYRSRALVKQEMTRFFTIQLACFVLGNLVFWLAVARLGLNVIIGGILLTLVNVTLSYVACEIWVFRSKT